MLPAPGLLPRLAFTDSNQSASSPGSREMPQDLETPSWSFYTPGVASAVLSRNPRGFLGWAGADATPVSPSQKTKPGIAPLRSVMAESSLCARRYFAGSLVTTTWKASLWMSVMSVLRLIMVDSVSAWTVARVAGSRYDSYQNQSPSRVRWN